MSSEGPARRVLHGSISKKPTPVIEHKTWDLCSSKVSLSRTPSGMTCLSLRQSSANAFENSHATVDVTLALFYHTKLLPNVPLCLQQSITHNVVFSTDCFLLLCPPFPCSRRQADVAVAPATICPDVTEVIFLRLQSGFCALPANPARNYRLDIQRRLMLGKTGTFYVLQIVKILKNGWNSLKFLLLK